MGLRGSLVRSIIKSILAWRPLLRAANDQIDQGDGKAGLFVAHLP